MKKPPFFLRFRLALIIDRSLYNYEEPIMSRTRLLSNDAVLERALPVFWQRGYADASLRDLTQATGLSSAALYNRFSNKEGLFVEVLRHYADQGLLERLGRLSAFNDPLEAIRSFYDELLQLSLADPDCKGCLLINTALDGAAISPAARALVRARLAQLEDFFSTQLQRGVANNALPSSMDIPATAIALLSTVFGLRVLARLDPDPMRLRLLVEHSLASFLPPRST